MNTQANQPLHLPLLSGRMTAALVAVIAIASLAITAQGFDGVSMPARPPEAATAPDGAVTGANKCAECGVIESARRIEVPDELIRVHGLDQIAAGKRNPSEGTTAGVYAITIRLQDGTRRTVTDAHPAKWRPGERVTLIGAAQ